MASDKDSPGPGKGSAPGRRKRPVEPRPIELEATELRDEATEESGGSIQQPKSTEASDEESPVEEASAPQEPQDEAAAAEPPSEGAADDPGSSLGNTESPARSDQEGGSQQDERSSTPPAQAQRQPRFPAALLAAGATGGIVALLSMFGLGMANIWPSAEDAALRAELAATQARLAALEETEIEIPPAADPEAIDGLAARLEALEAQFEDAVEPPANVAAMDERLADVEATAGQMVTSEQMDEALSEIGERVDELAGVLSGLAEGIGPDPRIAERLSQLESAFVEERDAREALVTRIESVESSVEGAAAASVMLSSLARAVGSGRPYASELAALEPLIDDPEAVETLAAHAETGLPSTRALAEEFAERTSAILGAREDGEQPPGYLSRIMEAAGSLVRVRPAGPMEGDSRAAIVSRIEAALAGGNVDVAHEEWQGFDPPAREASAQWASALGDRRAAEGELESLFAALSAASGQQANGSN